MTTNFSQDASAQSIAVASVRRHSMAPHLWTHTVIGCLHPGLVGNIPLLNGELPIASGFFSSVAWWLVSTQRVVGMHQGVQRELDPRPGLQYSFGHFKGLNASATEIATVTSAKTGETVQFEFETGNASMAPIYACMFWSRAARRHRHEGR